jgi:hypothetical protein
MTRRHVFTAARILQAACFLSALSVGAGFAYAATGDAPTVAAQNAAPNSLPNNVSINATPPVPAGGTGKEQNHTADQIGAQACAGTIRYAAGGDTTRASANSRTRYQIIAAVEHHYCDTFVEAPSCQHGL